MNKKTIILIGSSRNDGNTSSLVNSVQEGLDASVVYLTDKNISYFDYDLDQSADNFIPLIQEMLRYDQLVFATPVYWYAMSGRMKTFFDRFTDLITTHKELGRSLAGKSTFLISTGSSPEIPLGFELPFRETSAYLDMDFKGTLYASATDIEESNINICEFLTLFE